MRVVVSFKDGSTWVSLVDGTPAQALTEGIRMALSSRDDMTGHAGAWCYPV